MMPMSMPPLPGMPAPPGSMGGMGMPMGGLGSLGTPNVLSAAPQLINRADGGEAKKLGAPPSRLSLRLGSSFPLHLSPWRRGLPKSSRLMSFGFLIFFDPCLF